MSYAPGPSHYAPQTQYTPPGSPGRRNLALVGGIVVGITVLLLGSILLIVAVNRSGTDGASGARDGDSGEGTSTADEVSDSTVTGDPAEVAVTVVKIMYGLSDESAAPYVCAEPGLSLGDPDTTAELMEEMGLGSGLIDDVVAGESNTEGDTASVEVEIVVSGVSSPMGTIELVLEQEQWLACDLSY